MRIRIKIHTHICARTDVAQPHQVSIFEGACYTTPLLGAVCADAMWGRYKTILIFSVIYMFGILLLTASSYAPFGGVPEPDQTPDWLDYTLLCTALGVIALGTGGIKPNVSSFGADQFNPANPQDAKEKVGACSECATDEGACHAVPLLTEGSHGAEEVEKKACMHLFIPKVACVYKTFGIVFLIQLLSLSSLRTHLSAFNTDFPSHHAA